MDFSAQTYKLFRRKKNNSFFLNFFNKIFGKEIYIISIKNKRNVYISGKKFFTEVGICFYYQQLFSKPK